MWSSLGAPTCPYGCGMCPRGSAWLCSAGQIPCPPCIESLPSPSQLFPLPLSPSLLPSASCSDLRPRPPFCNLPSPTLLPPPAPPLLPSSCPPYPPPLPLPLPSPPPLPSQLLPGPHTDGASSSPPADIRGLSTQAASPTTASMSSRPRRTAVPACGTPRTGSAP